MILLTKKSPNSSVILMMNQQRKSGWKIPLRSGVEKRAIYMALMESIAIADGQDDKKQPDAIPSILSDALAVSFDNHVGHDYLQDYAERFDLYNKKEEKIEFDLEFFNKITKGGIPNKTLNIALAGTGVGKSLFMCHVASSVLLQGKNVLYITWRWLKKELQKELMLIF